MSETSSWAWSLGRGLDLIRRASTALQSSEELGRVRVFDAQLDGFFCGRMEKWGLFLAATCFSRQLAPCHYLRRRWPQTTAKTTTLNAIQRGGGGGDVVGVMRRENQTSVRLFSSLLWSFSVDDDDCLMFAQIHSRGFFDSCASYHSSPLGCESSGRTKKGSQGWKWVTDRSVSLVPRT